jgi:hypothetical protein
LVAVTFTDAFVIDGNIPQLHSSQSIISVLTNQNNQKLMEANIMNEKYAHHTRAAPSPSPSQPPTPPQSQISKPKPKPKSQAQLFLEITAISGEYPAENIYRIFSSSSYAKKKISALTAEKLIKVVNKGGIKGYRLAIGGKRKLMADNPARFAGYLDGDVETNKMRADHARRLRLHSMAQVHTFMHNAGVRFFKMISPTYLPNPHPAHRRRQSGKRKTQ